MSPSHANLIELLNNDDDIKRREAAFDLAEKGADAMHLLVESIESQRPRVRMGAAYALGLIDDVEVITDAAIVALTQALGDKVEYVRERAACSLGVIGERSVPLLMSNLSSSKIDELGWTAIALGNVGPKAKQAVPLLLPLLSNDSDFVRIQSASALGKIAVSDITFLIESLHVAIRSRDDWGAESLIIALRKTKLKSDEVYLAFMSGLFSGLTLTKEQAIAGIKEIDPNAIIRRNKKSFTFDNPPKRIAIAYYRRTFPEL